MQKLYETQNKVFLYLLKSELEAQGIQCLIKNIEPPLAGEIPPIVACPELWVMQEKNMTQAKKILEQELLTRSKHDRSWQCPQCSEKIDGQFNLCWRCGHTR